ncbi:MAG: S4 domain-containing protein [Candidatus Poribacteria bacterium]|nr:S4 domain-containing protein [Candidatus Poribacteria bacterium]MDE0324496.1 S4 domain-containing protein [Candidatus Poribacteria bacterium]
MRLDKFLQVSRLVKRRTIANTLCSKGAVSVNGHIAKAGKMLVVGDVIRLPGPAPSAAEVHPADIAEVPESEYEILELPTGNVSRSRAATLYRQLNP